MKRYLRIYTAIVKTGISNFIAYRLDTIVDTIFTSGIWAFLNVASMYVIINKSTTVFGWSVGELLLISCLYNVFIGIFGFFFSRGFTEFSEIIDTGRLDLVLLKPIDSQFFLSLRNVGVAYMVRVMIGLAMAVFIIATYKIQIAMIGILLFMLTAALGMLLLYSLLFGLNILVFWAPKLDNINELFYSLRSLGRYPRQTFRQLGEVGFLLLSPFVIILSVPSKMLMGKGTMYDFFELLTLAIAMFLFTRIFWKLALRHYTSASS